MNNDPNQFSREAWDANAEHWDSRMGDNGYEESTPIARIRVDIPTNGSSAFVVGSRTGGVR